MAILNTGRLGHVGHEPMRQALAAGHVVIAHFRNLFCEADAKALRGPAPLVRCDLAMVAEVAARQLRRSTSDRTLFLDRPCT